MVAIGMEHLLNLPYCGKMFCFVLQLFGGFKSLILIDLVAVIEKFHTSLLILCN